MKTTSLRRAALAAAFSLTPLFAHADGDDFTRFAGFALGSASLEDVQSRLGDAPLTRSVDSGGPVASICYTTDAGRVTFMSAEATEPEGKQHRLDGVALSSTKGRFSCAAWPKDVEVPALGLQNLRLGIGKSAFLSALGSPSQWSDYKSKITARYDNRGVSADDAPLIQVASKTGGARSAPAGLNSSVSVSGSFQRDKLTYLEVWKIQTL